MQQIHFIAIGGSAMHNLAIALQKKGIKVTGSDDEIFDPSKGRLEKYGLLPAKIGWDETNIHEDLDAVILGMHARENNPELLKAKELGLKIYSYPEYIYEATKDKTRVVIGGSHGKTTITSMILHVCQHLGIDVDYMVGAQLEGFEVMVKLTHEAKFAILEGDEYLSSPIDRRPKFHLYKPNIALLSGIAWDHINVFPTWENYIEQFETFINLIEKEGALIYFEGDDEIKKLVETSSNSIDFLPYHTPKHSIENGITTIEIGDSKTPLAVFGEHNLQNLNGARLVCEKMGINAAQFLEAIKTFSGASKRLELLEETKDAVIYKDFAHSPSKLKATTKALKKQYPNRELVACMELHTFSSLNQTFLTLYKGAMDHADVAYVYFNPEAVKHKKLAHLNPQDVKHAFDAAHVEVFTDSALLVEKLKEKKYHDRNLLLMSSGNFGGLNLEELAEELIKG